MSHPSPLVPNDEEHSHLLHPIVPRRERTLSQCERSLQSPSYEGVIHEFCREKGFGLIQPNEKASELIFVHVSDIDDDYVPKKGDTVTFKKMLMPPKNEKVMAVHIKLLHLADGVKHESWEEAVEQDIEHRRASHSEPNSVGNGHEPANNGDHHHGVVTHVD